MLSIGRQERLLRKLSPIFFQVETRVKSVVCVDSNNLISKMEEGFQKHQRNRCGGGGIFSPDVAGRIQAESEFQCLGS